MLALEGNPKENRGAVWWGREFPKRGTPGIESLSWQRIDRFRSRSSLSGALAAGDAGSDFALPGGDKNHTEMAKQAISQRPEETGAKKAREIGYKNQLPWANGCTHHISRCSRKMGPWNSMCELNFSRGISRLADQTQSFARAREKSVRRGLSLQARDWTPQTSAGERPERVV